MSKEVFDLENGGRILKHNRDCSHGVELVSTHLDKGNGAKLGADVDHSLMLGRQVQGDDLNRLTHT